MSGIFGYAGENPCKEILLEGLLRLAERGGELSGIAVKSGDGIALLKREGTPEDLKRLSGAMQENGSLGIAECTNALRTTAANDTAPPFSNRMYSAVLDGYIENFDILKAWLSSAVPIATDEELLLALLSRVNSDNRLEMIKKITSSIAGNPSFAFLAADENAVYCRAGENPILIGIAEDGYFISSEARAMIPDAVRYLTLGNGETARVTPERVTVYDSKMKRIKKPQKPLLTGDFPTETPLSGGVLTCPLAVKETVGEFVSRSQLKFEKLRLNRRGAERIKNVIITGSGPALNAARLGAYNFEMLTDIPTLSLPSGELRYSGEIIDKGTLIIAVSKSGESEDLAACIRRCEKLGAKTMTLTSNKNSQLSRLCDDTILTSPLDEFISSYLALAFFMLYLGYKNDIITEVHLNVTIKLAEMLAGKVSSSIKNTPLTENTAKRIQNSYRVLITGLGADGYAAAEAARIIRAKTKINAVSCHCCELAAEDKEMLSGSLVLAFVTNKELAQKSLRYIRRIKTLGAEVIIITTEGIETDIPDFREILTIPDSVPLFNPVTAVSLIHKISQTAKELSGETHAQQAI